MRTITRWGGIGAIGSIIVVLLLGLGSCSSVSPHTNNTQPPTSDPMADVSPEVRVLADAVKAMAHAQRPVQESPSNGADVISTIQWIAIGFGCIWAWSAIVAPLMSRHQPVPRTMPKWH